MRRLEPATAYQLLTAPDAMQLGKGLFETLLVVDGEPLFLREHLERLNMSLTRVGVCQCLLPELVYATIKGMWWDPQNSPSNTQDSPVNTDRLQAPQRMVLKLSVFLEGASGYWHIALSKDRYSAGIPWPFVLSLASWPQASAHPLGALKTMNYWARSLDLQTAATAGRQEVIYCDEAGHLMEGAKTNLFVYKAKAWFTPRVESGILDGIARKWLIGALTARGYRVVETPLTQDDLKAAELLVVTNSLIGLTLGVLDGPMGDGQRAGIAAAQNRDLLDWLKTLQAAYRGGAYGQFEENA